MPYIQFHALTEDQVANISKDLKQELATALNIAETAWEIELIQSEFFNNGGKVTTNPLVEIIWMTRAQEAQDTAAKIISENLKRLIGRDSFILFRNVAKETFYKNGVHY